MQEQVHTNTEVLTREWVVAPVTEVLLPKVVADEPLELVAITEVGQMERLELIACVTSIFGAPPAYVKPVERFGRIVTVSTEPAHAPGDPFLPIPLAEMSASFWEGYRRWFRALSNYLRYAPNPFGDTKRKSELLCSVARRYGEELAGMVQLSEAENRYFRLRITAALMGDAAG